MVWPDDYTIPPLSSPTYISRSQNVCDLPYVRLPFATYFLYPYHLKYPCFKTFYYMSNVFCWSVRKWAHSEWLFKAFRHSNIKLKTNTKSTNPSHVKKLLLNSFASSVRGNYCTCFFAEASSLLRSLVCKKVCTMIFPSGPRVRLISSYYCLCLIILMV